jgi:HD-GYP domain-containing protein (c-di-GMP phosphodiesterase class II)
VVSEKITIDRASEWAREAESLEFPDRKRANHAGALMALFATECDVPDDADVMAKAVALLDIGKIGVNTLVLRKPSTLSDLEMANVQRHVQIGVALLETSTDPVLQQAIAMISCHHECWDGTGYPANLAGEEIPLQSRMAALVDAYDSMTSPSVHRTAIDHLQAIQQIRSKAGTQFDPSLIRPFERAVNRLRLAVHSTKSSSSTSAARPHLRIYGNPVYQPSLVAAGSAFTLPPAPANPGSIARRLPRPG